MIGHKHAIRAASEAFIKCNRKEIKEALLAMLFLGGQMARADVERCILQAFRDKSDLANLFNKVRAAKLISHDVTWQYGYYKVSAKGKELLK